MQRQEMFAFDTKQVLVILGLPESRGFCTAADVTNGWRTPQSRRQQQTRDEQKRRDRTTTQPTLHAASSFKV